MYKTKATRQVLDLVSLVLTITWYSFHPQFYQLVACQCQKYYLYIIASIF